MAIISKEYNDLSVKLTQTDYCKNLVNYHLLYVIYYRNILRWNKEYD